MEGFTALALEALVLAAASSIDAFMAGFSCGVGKVKIPPKSIWVISGICSLTLGLSLWLGNLLAPFIPAGLAGKIGGGLLLLIGVYKLFESLMKGWLRRREREIHFRLFHVRCILKIYVDPTEADLECIQPPFHRRSCGPGDGFVGGWTCSWLWGWPEYGKPCFVWDIFAASQRRGRFSGLQDGAYSLFTYPYGWSMVQRNCPDSFGRFKMLFLRRELK